MGRGFRIKLHIRRFARRYPRLTSTIRSFMIFSAVFGGAYGFITGSRAENSGYDPNAFAIGASFLFAIACVALAASSFRLRFLRRKLRKVASALVDKAIAGDTAAIREIADRVDGKAGAAADREPDGEGTIVVEIVRQGGADAGRSST